MTAVSARPKAAARAPKAEKVKAAARPRTADVLVFGASPRVHLLPPEVIARKRGKIIRGRLGLGIVAVVVLVGCGIGIATVSMLAAQNALVGAQSTASALLVQQHKYVAVTSIQSDVAAIKASQKVATATEIQWQPYSADLEATLPQGMTITAINAVIDGPAVANAATGAVPLEGPRIGTVSVTVSSNQASISAWVARLTALKGFVDAQPKSVTLGDGGKYTVVVDIHVDKGALANRFAKVK